MNRPRKQDAARTATLSKTDVFCKHAQTLVHVDDILDAGLDVVLFKKENADLRRKGPDPESTLRSMSLPVDPVRNVHTFMDDGSKPFITT